MMLDNLNPLPREEGHVFVIHGAPKDYEDLEFIKWVMYDYAFMQEQGARINPTVVEQAFSLPYGQGAGFTEVYLYCDPPNLPEGYVPDGSPRIGYERWRNHWVRIGYADSMTNIWVSPVFRGGVHFLLAEY